MRPLEYQAWDKETKTFCDYFAIDYHGNILARSATFGGLYDFYGGNINESKRFILRLFTGLLDKNGTKIFEGDIMKFEHDDIVSVVNYDINRACYVFKGWIDEYGDDTTLDRCYRLLEMASVIGNIFESPELIK